AGAENAPVLNHCDRLCCGAESLLPATTLGRLAPQLCVGICNGIGRPDCSVMMEFTCHPPMIARESGLPDFPNGSSHSAVSTNRCGASYRLFDRSPFRLLQSCTTVPVTPPGRTCVRLSPISISFDFEYAASSENPFEKRRSTLSVPAWKIELPRNENGFTTPP